METRSVSLAEAYPKEQERVRSLLTIYDGLGAVGMFGAAAIREVLARAEKAAAEHDTVAMLRSYAELQGCE
jgi:hypothetical protein